MSKPTGHYIIWIAWRNLISRKKHGLSFMTAISIFGSAIGVASLIIVLSVMGGFEADLKNKLLRGDPHLEIVSPNQAAGFSLKEFPLEKFAKLYPQANAVNGYIRNDVIMKVGEQVAGVTLMGIDEGKAFKDKKMHSPWLFHSTIIDGEFDPILSDKPLAVSKVFINDGKEVRKYHKTKTSAPPILLGIELANNLNVEVGSEVVVLSPQSSVDGMLGGNQMVHRFVVAGIFQTDFGDYDTRGAVVAMDEARKFMADYDETLDELQYVTGVGLSFPDPMNLNDYKKIPKDWNLETIHWRDNNKAILFALKLEKYAMGSILMLIVIVAAFSISGTLIMTVFHRRGQVALFRAIGMSSRSIASLFIAHGLFIGGVGVMCGLVVGLGVCYILANFHWLPMPDGIFYLKYVPVKFLPFDYVVICFAACLLSIIAAIYPAYAAAKSEPAQGLRYL